MKTLSQNELADLCGLTPRRIRELAAEGKIPKPKGGKYPADETLRALFSYYRAVKKTAMDPLRKEQIRAMKAKADCAEREEEERRGMLLPREDVRRFLINCFLPVRQRLLAMPAECAARANPTDPTFARDALQRWVDESLPLIRGELPNPNRS